MVQLPEANLVEEVADEAASAEPGGEADAVLADGLQDVEVLYLISESQSNSNMIEMASRDRAGNPGSELVVGSKEEDVACVDLVEEGVLSDGAD